MTSIISLADDEAMTQVLRHLQTNFAKDFELDLESYLRLSRSLPYEELITCLVLLAARRPRSHYRRRCASKVRRWVAGESLASKPLSQQEFFACKPTWAITWSLPTMDDARRHVARVATALSSTSL